MNLRFAAERAVVVDAHGAREEKPVAQRELLLAVAA